MAGISKLHTDAATMTPAAKPVRARWMPSLRDFFKKNTQPAPRLVPRKGIKIPQNASCIMSNLLVVNHATNHIKSILRSGKKVKGNPA